MEISENIEKSICQKHGEYEKKSISLGGKTIALRCPSCQKDDEKQELEREKFQKRDHENRKIQGLLQRAGIPLRFKNKNLNDYNTENDGQLKAKTQAKKYLANWPQMLENGTSLIFCGNAGTGKTHLSCAIANGVIEAGYSAMYSTVSDAIRSIKRTYAQESNMTEGEAIAALVAPSLLVLDEVGADLGTDHSKTLLFDIFNKRYENMKPTIVLTNLDPQALREYMGERVVDRLREGGGKLVTFNWESNRS